MEVQFHQLDLKIALLGRPQTPPRLTRGWTQPWGAWDACLPPGTLHTRPQAWVEKSWPHWMPGPSRALPGKEGWFSAPPGTRHALTGVCRLPGWPGDRGNPLL